MAPKWPNEETGGMGTFITGIDLSKQSIWSAALMSAGCKAHARRATYGVCWQPASDHIRYVATEAVTVEPFGVRLAQGEVMEIRWRPGATSYSIEITSERRTDD
jgi:hypothetical protein